MHIFYIKFYSFSTKENSYLKMFWRGAFDAILVFNNRNSFKSPSQKKMSKILCKKYGFCFRKNENVVFSIGTNDISHKNSIKKYTLQYFHYISLK
jgi:hypothetical protein